jgi:hypothetical protein
MFDLSVALIGIASVLAITLLWVFKGKVLDIFKYFKENLGVTKGVVIFTGAFILLAVLSLWVREASASQLTYFNYGEVFIGADYTKKLSPQCYSGGRNDRLTSNGGVKVNLLRTQSRIVEVNSYYIHHSCFINEDREQYDAFGVQVTWKLWGN